MRIYRHKFYDNIITILSKKKQSFDTIIINFITNMFFVKKNYIEKINDSILILTSLFENFFKKILCKVSKLELNLMTSTFLTTIKCSKFHNYCDNKSI